VDTQYQAYQRIYDDTFTHLYELNKTQLMDTVVIDTNLTGMTKVYNQMGKLEAVDKTAKHQTIDPQEADHSARHLIVKTKFVPAILDKEQGLQMIKDPTSDVYQEAVSAIKRKQTKVLMDSFFSDVIINEDGGSTAPFSSNNQVAVNYSGGPFGQNSGASNISLNVDKLMAVRKKLSNAEIMINDSEMSKLHIAVTEEEVQKLMANVIGTDNYPMVDSNFTSMRISLEKAVDTINDNMFYWNGFHFHVLAPQYFSLDASGHRRIPVWLKSGMVYGMKENMKSTIADLPNTVESIKVQVLTRVGGLRKHDAKVHEIKCVVA
jgi:hypothetical protein